MSGIIIPNPIASMKSVITIIKMDEDLRFGLATISKSLSRSFLTLNWGIPLLNEDRLYKKEGGKSKIKNILTAANVP
jgi:hypothetical protein